MDFKDLLARVKSTGVGTADVVDAIWMLHSHRSHISGLVGPPGNETIIGPALTISFMPTRDDVMDRALHGLGPAFYQAVADHDPSGAVLVMASNGHPTTSMGGSTKLSRVENFGMAGVVSDGSLRDFDEIGAYSFSAYCHGEAIMRGGPEVLPFLSDVPVAVGGVTVIPGDIIFADPTGVAVVPAAEADKIFEMAIENKAAELGMLQMIAAEDPAVVLAEGSGEV